MKIYSPKELSISDESINDFLSHFDYVWNPYIDAHDLMDMFYMSIDLMAMETEETDSEEEKKALEQARETMVTFASLIATRVWKYMDEDGHRKRVN